MFRKRLSATLSSLYPAAAIAYMVFEGSIGFRLYICPFVTAYRLLISQSNDTEPCLAYRLCLIQTRASYNLKVPHQATQLPNYLNPPGAHNSAIRLRLSTVQS